MSKHDRFEWIEEYASCPRCDSDNLVAFTEFSRLSNEEYDTKFNLHIECENCDSMFKPELFKTKASTRVLHPE